MQPKKINELIDRIVDTLKKKDEYHTLIEQFFQNDSRGAAKAVEVEKQHKRLYVYTGTPQQYTYIQTRKMQLLAFLKKQNATADIEQIVVRIGKNER